MRIEILGTESLGVRGLCCLVQTKDRKIVIDPGIALGWSRYGFLPHPFQVAVGAGIREKIIHALKEATDVVISHFDGDHIPLPDPNPYQLGIEPVKEFLPNIRIWAKGPAFSSPTQKRRRESIETAIGNDLLTAEGEKDGLLKFSFPVPHGEREKEKGMVMMTRIEEGGDVFVHASDIQLFDAKTIEAIIYWKPTIVLASGPPLYRLFSSSSKIQRERAWKNAVNLAKNVDTLILDHHLLRSEEGVKWLKKLSQATKNKVFCAADFMRREPLFLEAWRKQLYKALPVSTEWHKDYAQRKANFNDYRIEGWEVIRKKGKIKGCKYYLSCPIKKFTDQGELEKYWIENYCFVSNKNCIRYQMEERGQYHPDNMLPNGEIRKDIKIT